VRAAGRWLTGFAPLWLDAILLAYQALTEMNDATERQVTR
jgi:hypothetical protein